MINDFFRIKIPVYRRKINFESLSLQFFRILLAEKIIPVLDHIIQDKETVNLPQESYLVCYQRVYLVVFAKKYKESLFIHWAHQVTENCPVTGITNNATEKIEVHHAAAHTKPVIIPTAEQFKIIHNGKIADIPINKDRDRLE